VHSIIAHVIYGTCRSALIDEPNFYSLSVSRSSLYSVSDVNSSSRWIDNIFS